MEIITGVMRSGSIMGRIDNIISKEMGRDDVQRELDESCKMKPVALMMESLTTSVR